MNLSAMSGETLAALLTPCLPSVRRMVQSRLRAWDEAEDVLQQTLLQAFRHRGQLQAHCKFKSWLWSIAHERNLHVPPPRPNPLSPTGIAHNGMP
jgi:DNA-directed RNA polymerase specialized sigma24 family protein